MRFITLRSPVKPFNKSNQRAKGWQRELFVLDQTTKGTY